MSNRTIEHSPAPAEQEPFQPISKKSFIARWSALGAVHASILIIKDTDGTRGHIPEPFDVIDHAGNMSLSFSIGVIAALEVARRSLRQSSDTTIDYSSRPLRRKMIGSGIAVGVALNAYVETNLGLSINPIFGSSTPDMIDFAYGVGGATLGAAAMPALLGRPQFKR